MIRRAADMTDTSADDPQHDEPRHDEPRHDERGAFRILVDGDCPLCVKEAALLRRMDRGRGRLIIEDLTDPDFDPATYNATHDEVMGQIHGKGADGEVVTGVEVFRRAYRAVGWGWVLAWTKWPIVRPLVDRLYVWFAKNRLRFTGRTDACADGRCRVG